MVCTNKNYTELAGRSTILRLPASPKVFGPLNISRQLTLREMASEAKQYRIWARVGERYRVGRAAALIVM